MSARCAVSPGQMQLDLWGSHEKRCDPAEDIIAWLVESHSCDEGDVRPVVERLFREFPKNEAIGRAKALTSFFGKHAAERLRGTDPGALGMFDADIGYHVLWDRCWAARWIPLGEASRVSVWNYNYASPYTGAPARVSYVDADGELVEREF